MTSTSWLDFNGHRKPEILKGIFTTARYGQIRRLLVITQVLYDFLHEIYTLRSGMSRYIINHSIFVLITIRIQEFYNGIFTIPRYGQLYECCLKICKQ